jgi:hypothetical protein
MLLSYPATVNDLDLMKPKVGPIGALRRLLSGMVKEVLIIGWRCNTLPEYFQFKKLNVNNLQDM